MSLVLACLKNIPPVHRKNIWEEETRHNLKQRYAALIILRFFRNIRVERYRTEPLRITKYYYRNRKIANLIKSKSFWMWSPLCEVYGRSNEVMNGLQIISDKGKDKKSWIPWNMGEKNGVQVDTFGGKVVSATHWRGGYIMYFVNGENCVFNLGNGEKEAE